MLNKCANKACPRAFRSLSHGKLFLLEIDHAERPVASTSFPGRKERLERRVERYWLCDCCSSLFSLTFERGRGMVTVPLPGRNTLVPALHLKKMHQ